MSLATNTYTNFPNIVVRASNVSTINVGSTKNVAFGEVVVMYQQCWLYTVGDILLYNTEGAVQILQGTDVYYIISVASVKLAYRSGGVS